MKANEAKAAIKAAIDKHRAKAPPGWSNWTSQQAERFKECIQTACSPLSKLSDAVEAARVVAEAYGIPAESIIPADAWEAMA